MLSRVWDVLYFSFRILTKHVLVLESNSNMVCTSFPVAVTTTFPGDAGFAMPIVGMSTWVVFLVGPAVLMAR